MSLSKIPSSRAARFTSRSRRVLRSCVLPVCPRDVFGETSASACLLSGDCVWRASGGCWRLSLGEALLLLSEATLWCFMLPGDLAYSL